MREENKGTKEYVEKKYYYNSIYGQYATSWSATLWDLTESKKNNRVKKIKSIYNFE